MKLPQDIESVFTTMSPIKAVELLSKQRLKGEQLLSTGPVQSGEYEGWFSTTAQRVEDVFGVRSPAIGLLHSASKPQFKPGSATEGWHELDRAKNLGAQLRVLSSLEALLTVAEPDRAHGLRSRERASRRSRARIFVVHGHDRQAIKMVTEFLGRLPVRVTVLREKPDRGLTLFEKLNRFSRVDFTVVLLTPDDRGGAAHASYKSQLGRARQNVIFELGFFIGLLGRTNVRALYKPGVEIPSDYKGVLFIPFDDRGKWRHKLRDEMRAARLSI